MRYLCLGLALLFMSVSSISVTACSSGDASQSPSADAGIEAGATEELPPQPEPDIPAITDHELGPDCEPGSGCLGEVCASDDDCKSGLCFDHLGDMVCTETCSKAGDCAAGWTCLETGLPGPDFTSLFVCVSDFPFVCRPCREDADCSAEWGGSASCLDYGAEGNFCGGSCDANVCPPGYSCIEATTATGATELHCVSDTGTCECTATSIRLERSTRCAVTGEVGACEGERMCAAGGLTACDGAVPAAEICNGLDDDCDGTVDPALPGSDCDDADPCTADTCDGVDGCSYEPLSALECDDGNACTESDACVDGTCVGAPIACDDESPCTDDSCSPAEGCVFEVNLEPCDDADPCTVGDLCVGGACSGTAVACDCTVDADCGALEDGDVCNGTLVCDTSVVPHACVIDTATVPDCPEADSFCLMTTCDAVTGACGVAPDHEALACNDGDACTLGDICELGECEGPTALSCDDGNTCTIDSCDSVAGCVHEPHSSTCNDGDPCSVLDTCVDGACVGTGALDCNDGNPCTHDLCQPTVGCDHQSNTSPCDDGSACTLGDLCAGGVCTGGTPIDCDDSNACTDDQCDPEAGCTPVALTGVEVLCDDLNTCTTEDHCVDGVCGGTGSLECDDKNPCTKDICLVTGGCQNEAVDGNCSDGNPCTVSDVCTAGVCTAGPQVDCNDGNPCTTDACQVGQGCTYTHNEEACDDSNACTTGDSCSGGLCLPGPSLACDDGDVCTADGCTPGEGCITVPNSAPCNDGDACTLADVCAGGSCQGGQASVCDDNNPCTTDTCDPESGCVYTPTSEVCDDNNPCTTEDACLGGWCIGGAALDCDDDDVCTSDACSPPAGGCVHNHNVAPCEDNDPCTTADTCAEGTCSGGPPTVCNDNNECTNDSCHQVNGCTYTPNANPCDDGNPCTLDDDCKEGWCLGDVDLDCDDGNPCTTDVCIVAEGGCSHTANTSVCDDDNACTVGDFCLDEVCQTGVGALQCSDGLPCTADGCAPESGCTFEVMANCCSNEIVDSGEACDDGNTVGNDGCSADCKSDETCDNGILDVATEVCDGIVFGGVCHQGFFQCLDECQTVDTSECTSWCGDGVIDPQFEVCDVDVFPVPCDEGAFECQLGCKFWDKTGCDRWCGDGVADGDEDCDGADFAVDCPLSECVCSSDCTLNWTETSGDDWQGGDFNGTSTVPGADGLAEECYDTESVCLDATKSELKDIWIANSADHEVVRINTDTGEVEMETTSYGQNPSRTALVVADGSVWVANRGWDCVNDANCSNVVHLDNDGNLICRGDATGMIRALALDTNGDVWAGAWTDRKFYKFSGSEVDDTQDPPRCVLEVELPVAGCPYGAAVDSQGMLWLANNCAWANNFDPAVESIQAIDTHSNTVLPPKVAPTALTGCFSTYGLTVDSLGRVLIGAYPCDAIFRHTPSTDSWEKLSLNGRARGLVVAQDGYIYQAISHNSNGSCTGRMARVAPDMNSVSYIELPGMCDTVGAAIDRNGWVWTAGRSTNNCARIDANNWDDNPQIDVFPTNGNDPYTYSDMTGFQHLLFTNPEGTWNQTYDGGAATVFWQFAEWTGIEANGVTDILVRARSAATEEGLAQAGWTAYITDSPANLEGLPNLRWLELEVKLTSSDPIQSPILHSIYAHWTK